MPLRFPELSTITFSGPERNVYADGGGRMLYFLTTYNKNKQYGHRLSFLDAAASAKLLWFILILRPFTIELLKDELAQFKGDMYLRHAEDTVYEQDVLEAGGDSSEDENVPVFNHARRLTERVQLLAASSGAATVGAAVLKEFLWVDIEHHRLLGLNQFNTELMRHPRKGTRHGMTIRLMRQALASLWKNAVHEVGKVELLAKGFGHNALTHLNIYGFNRDSDVNSGAQEDTFVEVRNLSARFMAAVDPERLQRYRSHFTTRAKRRRIEHQPGPVCGVEELFAAGRRFLNCPDFDFRNRDQLLFTTNVLFSRYRALGLQAATAFAKSLTFLLPMMFRAAERPNQYLHFIGVPYEALKRATVKKVAQTGLRVALVTELLRPAPLQYIRDTDVFVGCWETFAEPQLVALFRNWDSVAGSAKKLGYFVFDEAHTLFFDSTYRPQLNEVRALGWENWEKVLFLSATMDAGLFQTIAEDRRLPDYMISQRYFMNAVKEVPNAQMRVDCIWRKRSMIVDDVRRLIHAFLTGVAEGKAVFFFGNKKTMAKAYRGFRSNERVVQVSASESEEHRRMVFEMFEDGRSLQRVILGTKLISNGLDCPSVRFVCLVDFRMNAVDYLQMVGRIRGHGYIRVLYSGTGGVPLETTSRGRNFPLLNFRECITEQIARYYGLEGTSHARCCGEGTDDEWTREIRARLDAGGTPDVSASESGGETDPATVGPLEEKLQGRGFLHLVLGAGYEHAVQGVLLGLNVVAVLSWRFNPSTRLCRECWGLRHESDPCHPLKRELLTLSAEILLVLYVAQDKKFEEFARLLEQRGSYDFVLDMLQDEGLLRRWLLVFVQKCKLGFGNVVFKEGAGCYTLASFRLFFAFLLHKKVNVAVLLKKQAVVASPALFSNLDNYVGKLFHDTATVAALSAGELTHQKVEVLGALETWVGNNQRECPQLYTLIKGRAHTGVFVSLVWSVFEFGLTRVLGPCSVDATGMPQWRLFPLFFRNMVRTVTVEGVEQPLFAAVIGLWYQREQLAPYMRGHTS
ncbi:DEAD/DEAH box helicase KNAG_0G03680 [Huiozyma naganishii CBS 8797]|uniref:ATP-dependent RNA helicase n=1 Tax=Huiozyma naganishii (strain ATCC MYA-139 / BCRC 22969 / CBS 8797 / KCTC 17520 / NBRC 10181 / NCYC 3082 / Yp74L-3) TaxID=1071383 RepID=J7S892_HUIN7|nr:hypothetical protein KNAG_0G03680 [Kazachstania naganishii CBS 8797]CCK71424.1 hypothetical protein KNAG_0G03680 [Kazachstania naganishii CBS 8797]